MKINAFFLSAGLALTMLTPAAAQQAQPDSIHVHILQNVNGNLKMVDTTVAASQHDQLRTWLTSQGVELPPPPPGEMTGDSMRVIVIDKIESDSFVPPPGMPPMPPHPGEPLPPGMHEKIMLMPHGKMGDPDSMRTIIIHIDGDTMIAPAKMPFPPPPPGAHPKVLLLPPDGSDPGADVHMIIIKDSAGVQCHKQVMIRQAPCGAPPAAQKTGSSMEKVPQKEMTTADHLTVYPNPSNGHITLSFDVPFRQKTQVVIFDMNGKAVYKEDLGDSGGGHYQKEIDLSRYGKGAYTIEVTKGDKVVAEKIMVE